MRIYTAITTICITFLLFGCKQNSTNKKNDTVLQQKNNQIINKKIVKKTLVFFKEENCPCIMPKKDGRYGSISYKGSLVDNQKELVIKLCENGNNNYALSLESWASFDNKGKLKRGKIYDYKVLQINDSYVAFTDDGCKLKNTGEHLYMIQLSKGIHSIWRISKGKLIELDKKKEYPCIDYEEMPYE